MPSWLASALIGFSVSVAIWFSSRDLPIHSFQPVPRMEGGLSALGDRIIRNHLMSFEAVALTLALVVIGAGIIARTERGKQDSS